MIVISVWVYINLWKKENYKQEEHVLTHGRIIEINVRCNFEETILIRVGHHIV